MVSVRAINRACIVAAALCAIGALVAIAAAVWWPYDVRTQPGRGMYATLSRTGETSTRQLTIADFEPLLVGNLGHAVNAPLPTTAPLVEAPPPPAPQTPPVQLIGTITEPDRSYAVFQTAEGVELKRVGEDVANARVIEISEGVAVMRQGDGQSLTLRVPTPPG